MELHDALPRRHNPLQVSGENVVTGVVTAGTALISLYSVTVDSSRYAITKAETGGSLATRWIRDTYGPYIMPNDMWTVTA
jgi:hypothetical protein